MQATIYPIDPFDASIGTTIKFNWNGDKINKNRCIIKDMETNESVYDNTIFNEMYKMEHTIDLSLANLVNGKKYYAYLTIVDVNGVESDLQTMGQPFLCLKTPEFRFENIVPGYTLQYSTGEFVLYYAQENNEPLDSWQISIYHNDAIVSSSSVMYDTSNLSYTISGFEDGEIYKIRATGNTVNGWLLDTGYITIHVSYKTATVFSMIELTNLPRQGAIQLHSNIISADGVTEKDTEYIGGEYLDLRDNTLTYNEGFLFDGNFSTVIYVYEITPNVPFLYFSSTNNELFEGILTYRTIYTNATTKLGYVELRIREGVTGIDYVCYSNKISYDPETNLLGVNFARKDGYYNVEISNLGEINNSENE